jgi:serine/threonine-protein kinase
MPGTGQPGAGQPGAGQPGGGQPGGGRPGAETPPTQPAADAEVRTIFYRNQMAAPSVVSMLEREYVAVDRDQVYSAPWLGPIEGEPRSIGTLTGFALSSDRGSTLRQFHQVNVRTSAPARVGDQLRSFRVTRALPQVGSVVTPTGLLTVTAVHDSGAVAVVAKEYGRIQPGDLVDALPEFEAAVGVRAQDVTGGSEAMIMGFASNSQLKDIGQHAFLDLGSDHGIGVGDEFVLFSDATRSDVRGRLQVVSVTPTAATVRVMSMVDDVFRRGVIVRLVRQMP